MVASHFIHKGDYFINVLNPIRISVAKKPSHQHRAPPARASLPEPIPFAPERYQAVSSYQTWEASPE